MENEEGGRREEELEEVEAASPRSELNRDVAAATLRFPHTYSVYVNPTNLMETSPGQSNSNSHVTPVKRPRPVLSCLECRRKKLKCDRLFPCNQCQKSHLSCAYNSDQDTERRHSSVNGSRDESLRPQKRARPMLEEVLPGHSPTIPNAHVGIIEDLQARVSALERSLLLMRASSGHAKDAEVEQLCSYTVATEPHLPLSRARAHGKSLGLMANFDEARSFMQTLQRPSDDPEIQTISSQLRGLQDMVKGPKRPMPRPQPQAIVAEMLDPLPSREVCSHLLDVYFDNFEHCLRILHRPSFLVEHDRFWRTNNRDPTFVPRLLATLLVACSSRITPLCGTATLAGRVERASASNLLDSWGQSLKTREKASLHALQIGTLQALIHHERPLSVEETWSSTGSLLRLAMSGSLHLEPQSSILENEQRRRLWATLLELELASSVMCGMPTMLTPDDFTCRPPANIHDDDIAEDTVHMPPSRSTDTWTDSLCQFVLASSLRQRLEAYRLVTKPSPEIKYEDILDHARQLESMLQALPAPLRFASTSDDAARMAGRLYARIHLDMAIRRTMIALYTPFAVLSITQDPYKEARVGYVQSCLVITCYQDLFDPAFSEESHGDSGAYWDLFYQDFKRELLRSTLGICLEIKWMIHRGLVTDPPGASAAGIDPTKYYPLDVPSKLWKLPAWTLDSLTKSIDDTLEPMVRRIGRSGSDLKDLGCIAIVYHSIKKDGDAASRDAAMKAGLSELITACQRHLQQQQRQNIGAGPPSNGDSMSDLAVHSDSQYLTPELNFNFDDLWATNIIFDDQTAMTTMNSEAAWPLQY